MVFKAEDKKLTATLDINGKRQTYSAIIAGCPNPWCHCTAAHIRLTLLDEDGTEIAEPVTVLIDLETKKPTYADPENVSDEDKVLAETLAASLTDDDMEVVQTLYFAYKRHITDNADLDSIDIDLPVDMIENEGAMIGYSEILPYSKEFRISANDKDFMVLDQYCLRTGCGCKNVVLSPVMIHENGKTKELPAFRVDYHAKKWEKASESKLWGKSIKLDVFREKMLEAHPTIYSELKQRHQNLKRVYANSKRSHAASQPVSPVRSTKKAGRNDTCPCGSGKKYKKCCLNA